MTQFAQLIDSLPYVLNDGDRNARFPNPPRNFRVQYPDGSIKIFAGGAWATLLTPGAGSGTTPGDGTTPPPAGTFLPPDIASINFDDGTDGALEAFNPAATTYPVDPSGLLNGKVGRLRFDRAGAPGPLESIEAGWNFAYPRSLGQPMYFRGRFVIEKANLSGSMIRKLIYFKYRYNFAKYPLSIGGVNNRSVLVLQGSDLVVDLNWSPSIGSPLTDADTRTAQTIKTGLQGNTEYTLEVFQQLETAFDLYNGKFVVWLDGIEIFNKQNVRWTDSGWVGARGNKDYNWSAVGNGVVMEAGDIMFENFEFGHQYQDSIDYDEYRLWDDVAFSTTRIGP